MTEPMATSWTAPFTDEQVMRLQAHQVLMHPYTCPNCRSDLRPSRDGLWCTMPDCGYLQTWAHPFDPADIGSPSCLTCGDTGAVYRGTDREADCDCGASHGSDEPHRHTSWDDYKAGRNIGSSQDQS